jgi:hypothetical protein
MAVTLDDVGIQNYPAGTFCESVEYEAVVEDTFIPACDSSFGAAGTFARMINFTISGNGDLNAALVLGSDGSSAGAITGVTDGSGTRLIVSTEEGESNTGFNTFSATGEYYPTAV